MLDQNNSSELPVLLSNNLKNNNNIKRNSFGEVDGNERLISSRLKEFLMVSVYCFSSNFQIQVAHSNSNSFKKLLLYPGSIKTCSQVVCYRTAFKNVF
jgi:hypothetical protein